MSRTLVFFVVLITVAGVSRAEEAPAAPDKDKRLSGMSRVGNPNHRKPLGSGL